VVVTKPVPSPCRRPRPTRTGGRRQRSVRSVELSWDPASGAEVYKVLVSEEAALGTESRLVTSTRES